MKQKKKSKLDEPLKLMLVSQTCQLLHFIIKLSRKVQHPINLSLNDKINLFIYLKNNFFFFINKFNKERKKKLDIKNLIESKTNTRE